MEYTVSRGTYFETIPARDFVLLPIRARSKDDNVPERYDEDEATQIRATGGQIPKGCGYFPEALRCSSEP